MTTLSDRALARRRRRRGARARRASARRRPSKPQVRRHARDRHGLRDALGAVVGPADWNWKHNHDTGQFYEQLFAADLSKSEAQRRQASVLSPTPGCRPTPSAASWPRSWEWKENPLRVEIKLRKGVMFPEKPGVMEARELTADDVVFSYNRLDQEPEEDRRLFRSRRQGRGHRQAHRRLHIQGLQRRMGLPLRLGLLLGDHAEGSGRRRRRQLEERQRHRPVHADRVRAGQLQHLRQEPELLGQGEDRRQRVQAAVRRQDRLSHHQGRGDLHHRAAHRQARHPGSDPLAERRRAEEERAAAAVVEAGST